MCKRIFLVDLENVKREFLRGIDSLGVEDKVIVFHNRLDYNRELPKDILSAINNSKANINVRYLTNYHKDAMDFCLAVELGFLLASEKAGTKYYIVSNDKAFDICYNYAKDRGINAEMYRITSFEANNNTELEEINLKNKIKELLPDNNSYERNMVIKGLNQCKTKEKFHNFLQTHLKEDVYRNVYNKCSCLLAA